MPGSPRHLDYRIRRDLLAMLDKETSLDDIAAALGKTDARVLWHLRQMERDGVATNESRTSWRRTMEAEALLAVETTGPERAFPDRIVADFEDALRELDDGLYGEDAVQASGEHRTRLSTAQAADFRDRLLDLIAEYFAPGQGDREGFKYGFQWILTPIDLHPLGETRQRDAARDLIALGGTQPDLEIPARRRPSDITDNVEQRDRD